jgi:hypothetical protein
MKLCFLCEIPGLLGDKSRADLLQLALAVHFITPPSTQVTQEAA